MIYLLIYHQIFVTKLNQLDFYILCKSHITILTSILSTKFKIEIYFTEIRSLFFYCCNLLMVINCSWLTSSVNTPLKHSLQIKTWQIFSLLINDIYRQQFFFYTKTLYYNWVYDKQDWAVIDYRESMSFVTKYSHIGVNHLFHGVWLLSLY